MRVCVCTERCGKWLEKSPIRLIFQWSVTKLRQNRWVKQFRIGIDQSKWVQSDLDRMVSCPLNKAGHLRVRQMPFYLVPCGLVDLVPNQLVHLIQTRRPSIKTVLFVIRNLSFSRWFPTFSNYRSWRDLSNELPFVEIGHFHKKFEK